MHHAQVAQQRNWAVFHGADDQIIAFGHGTRPLAALSSLTCCLCAISAIVTMADSGDGSLRSMDELGSISSGDVRTMLDTLSRKYSLRCGV